MTTKTKTKTDKTLISLYSKNWVQFLLDKDSLDITAKVGSYESIVDKVKMDEIKKQIESAEKVALDVWEIKMEERGWEMWDRVFLYGPTGTWKTYSVLKWMQEQKIPHEMVTVSDWFEDLDFLTYIFPTKTGIQYKEKSIIETLRKAANGEKVAILIDEANRWSKSFLNFLLKAIDPVSDYYEINNYVADEVIKIPKDNIIWFCTANLWGWYVGANDIDEALLDRFNKVSFVWYNDKFEDELYKHFDSYAGDVREITEYVRQLFQDNELKRPISSRSLKIRAEQFVNTKKTWEDVFASFEKTVMYRLVTTNSYGFPNKDHEAMIVSKFMEKWFIKKS